MSPARVALAWNLMKSQISSAIIGARSLEHLDATEDPRTKILHPERYVDGSSWKDLRESGWEG